MPTLTIDFTAPHATRLAAAYGAKMGLSGPCNMAEFKAYLMKEFRSEVLAYETREAYNAAIAAAQVPSPIDPT